MSKKVDMSRSLATAPRILLVNDDEFEAAMLADELVLDVGRRRSGRRTASR